MSINLEAVTKAYATDIPVVENVSLEIESDELFVLLGASGSGKSTLLRLIAGLLPLDGGRIYLHGRDVTSLSPQQRNTGFVFQNYSLFQHMTVAQNIEFSLSIRHASRQDRERRVSELLSLIEMEGFGQRMPAQLSGGQQQRVALARALAHQPDVLLLDEPFGALDARIRIQLRQNLREIQKKLGITTILVTHDQDEAFELADRIGIIEQGQLLEVGTPSDLYRQPRHRFTATFLGNANLLPGRRNSHQVYIGAVALDAPPDTDRFSNQPVDILSRPEEVELAPTADSLRGQFIGRGIVQETAFAGPLERIAVELPHYTENGKNITLTALLTPDEMRASSVTPGQEVWVGLKRFHLIPRG
jgi:sulfate transport system ATP-binding protein